MLLLKVTVSKINLEKNENNKVSKQQANLNNKLFHNTDRHGYVKSLII